MACEVINVETWVRKDSDLPPVEALITAQMLEHGFADRLSDTAARKLYEDKIVYGKWSAGLGDFVVRFDR